MKSQTRELLIESLKIGEFYVNATLKVTMGDVGIGSYDFWGAKGVHTQMGIEELEVLSADWDVGQEDLPDMTAKEYIEQPRFDDELLDAAHDAWIANEPDDEPDDDDVDRVLARKEKLYEEE